jgi:dTDP-4-amino-4,6-dideoxygalactose transaminase
MVHAGTRAPVDGVAANVLARGCRSSASSAQPAADRRRARAQARDALREHLSGTGVGTSVHYPTPVHRQAAYAEGARAAGGLAVSEALAGEVLSLPCYPGLAEQAVTEVADAVRAFDTV